MKSVVMDAERLQEACGVQFHDGEMIRLCSTALIGGLLCVDLECGTDGRFMTVPLAEWVVWHERGLLSVVTPD